MRKGSGLHRLGPGSDQMKVSIIIPAYNAADFIGYAMKSALSQTHKDIEVIVVDDGSSDNTSDIIQRFIELDSRVFLIRNAQTLGPAAARNIALSHATGAWIALLDSDDEFIPERLEALLQTAEARSLDAVADGLEIIDFEKRNSLGPAFDPAWLKEEEPISLSYLLERDWPGRARSYGLGTIKPMVRKAFLDYNKLKYAEEFNLAEDLLFYCDLIILGAKFGLMDKIMYKYYIRKDSVSNNPKNPTQIIEANFQIQQKIQRSSRPDFHIGNELDMLKKREGALWFQIFTWSIKVRSVKFMMLAVKNTSVSFLMKNTLYKIWIKGAGVFDHHPPHPTLS
jgi:succinoglycan biosynthesis protein ExoO